MSQAQRMRYTPALHSRLLQHTRQSRVHQDLRIPAEVVRAVGAHYVAKHPELVQKLEDKVGVDGDVRLGWASDRKKYQFNVDGYGGSKIIGRITGPRNDLRGIVFWPRDIRDHILAPGYDQFDIVHAMPSILYHHFKHLDLPNLKCAMSDLEGMSPSNYRKIVKVMVTRALQCCPPTTIAEDAELDVTQEVWWNGLVREGEKIRDEMERLYPGFVELAKRKRAFDNEDPERWPATAIQLFYDDVEYAVQCKVLDKLGELLPELKDRTLICCDALFVPKIHGEVPGRIVGIMEKAVADMSIRYECKPMLLLPGTEVSDEVLMRVHDGASLTSARTEFALWKAEFERRHFYLLKEDRCCLVNEDTREIYMYTNDAFTRSVYAWEPRVKEWIADPQRKTYTKIVNMPPPLVCPPTSFNLWGFSNNFRAAELPELGPGDNAAALVDPILKAFRCAVSGDASSYQWMMCYIADMLQNPGIKRAQYVAVYGEQGVGKNELFERFLGEKIIGYKNFYSIGSMSLWADKYADQWQTKTMITITEVEPGDMRSYMGFIKSVTGSTHVAINTKFGAKYDVEFYGRVFMLTNHANAIGEDNTKARRIGLRCVCSDLRAVPDLLDYLNNPKAQRAFYDYMMDWDLGTWDPEKDRADNVNLIEANFMQGFKLEAGNFMGLVIYTSLDKLYEHYRRYNKETGAYNEDFNVPQAIFCDMLINCHGWEKKNGSNKHISDLSALATKIDPSGELKIMVKSGRPVIPYKYCDGRKKGFVTKPCFQFNYPKMKAKLQEYADKFKYEERFDMDETTSIAHAAIDSYHEGMQESGLLYCPDKVETRFGGSFRKAYRNKPGEEPAYVVKELTEVVFASNDLEEINKEMGEAWVEDGSILHNPRTGKQYEVDDIYMRPHGKMMLEKIFPFYCYDRTQ